MVNSELIKILKDGYRKILNDPNFERLEQLLDAPNIFRILKAKRAEIRHSNFLAWLLDPNESHGLSEKILIKFLRDVLLSGVTESISPFDLEEINFKKVEVLREHQNIDILIRLGEIIVCIENKFDTTDHSGQLLKYKNIVEKDYPNQRHIFVYLTPNGDDPNDEEMRKIYQNYSYIEFMKILELILMAKEELRPTVYTYIKDYLITIKQEIIGNDELNRLESELYNNHAIFLSQYNVKYLSINQNHDEIFERIKTSYFEQKNRINEGDFPLYLNSLEFILKKNNYKILKYSKNGIVFTTETMINLTGEYGDNKHGKANWGSNVSIGFNIGISSFEASITHLINKDFRAALNQIITSVPHVIETKDRSGGYGWHSFWKFNLPFNVSELETATEELRTIIIGNFIETVVNSNIRILEEIFSKNKEALIHAGK